MGIIVRNLNIIFVKTSNLIVVEYVIF